MSETALVDRVRAGHHTVVIGDLDSPAELLVIPVHGDLPRPPLAPLVELCAQIDAMLGAAQLAPSTSRRRVAERRVTERMYPGRLAGTLNRLAAGTNGDVAIWFHAFDRLDAASRDVVIACVREPGWVKLPLIFAADAGGEMINELADLIGDGAVIEGATPRAVELPALPDEVLRALRAAAITGDAFEIETVAELLVEDPVAVLEQLQIARDRGVPVRDRGGGVLALPTPLSASLRSGLLPSLRQAWNGLLAAAHGNPDDVVAMAPPPADELAPLPNLDALYGEPYPGALDAAEAILESAQPPGPSPQPARSPARAARHAVEAGQLEDAIEHMLAVAQQATEAGAFTEAFELVARAESAASRLPPSQRVTELRARAELERGTIAWIAIGDVGGESLTLASALEHLERALELGATNARLAAEIRATMAGVCFDLGDRQALERAVELLTEASRGLSEAGLALEAAQLLNEQASVWVRLGDPVRAYGLLQASRRVFEQLDTAEALVEIAGTDHQTARLTLHAEARPDRHEEAVEVGIALARRAVDVYERFGLVPEASWARETIGRLALRGGDLELAEAELSAAFGDQLERGDSNGLARTTAALADLAAERGEPTHALEALAESVAINIAKGSPIGLAFNLESLGRIDPDLALAGSKQLAATIHAAQSQVGVVENPGALYGSPA